MRPVLGRAARRQRRRAARQAGRRRGPRKAAATPRCRGATPARAPAKSCWLRRRASSSPDERCHAEHPRSIRPAASADAAALAEFGARTFYETFAADNTAEDMRLHLASAWSPDAAARRDRRSRCSTPCWPWTRTALSRHSRSCARTTRRPGPDANSHRAQALLRRQALAGQGPGARAHGRGRARRRGRAARANCGSVSGSATRARRRSIASAVSKRSARRSSWSAAIRRPIT